MLEDGVYITRKFNRVNVEVISNIQCYISTSKPPHYKKKNPEVY